MEAVVPDSSNCLKKRLDPKLNPDNYIPPEVDRIWGIWGSHYDFGNSMEFRLI